MILLYPNFDSTWTEMYDDGLPLRLKRAFFNVVVIKYIDTVTSEIKCCPN